MATQIKNNIWTALKRNRQEFGVISSADITGTAAGQFGHPNGYPLCVPVGSDELIILNNVIYTYRYSTVAYGAGGDVTVKLSGGGAAVTGLISAGNSFGASANKDGIFYPLAAAVSTTTSVAKGLNLVAAVAFTQPGTAAGVIYYTINYSVYKTNL
jgi:hypothetical protein